MKVTDEGGGCEKLRSWSMTQSQEIEGEQPEGPLNASSLDRRPGQAGQAEAGGAGGVVTDAAKEPGGARRRVASGWQAKSYLYPTIALLTITRLAGLDYLTG